MSRYGMLQILMMASMIHGPGIDPFRVPEPEDRKHFEGVTFKHTVKPLNKKQRKKLGLKYNKK
jgi:hypothetical protein